MSLLRGTGARLAAGATLALLALSGCSATPAPPPVTVSATPTAAPIFANDDEALAAAKKAYEAYQAMGDRIFFEGGKDGIRIEPFVSHQFAETEIEGFKQASANGWRSVGKSSFDNFTVQEIDLLAPGGISVVSAYLCADVSRVDVLDATGKSVVPASRQTRTPFRVTFDLAPGASSHLVVSSREVWRGDGVC